MYGLKPVPFKLKRVFFKLTYYPIPGCVEKRAMGCYSHLSR
jgi:hypothetical protein